MTVDHRPGGDIKIPISRVQFVLSGLVSAAVGAVVALALWRLTGWSLLPWSVTVVYGFMAMRRLFQALVYAPMLAVTLGQDEIRGPAYAWLVRGSTKIDAIDWDFSIVNDRWVILYSEGRRRFAVRLRWFSPSDRDLLRQHVEALRTAAYNPSPTSEEPQ